MRRDYLPTEPRTASDGLSDSGPGDWTATLLLSIGVISGWITLLCSLIGMRG